MPQVSEKYLEARKNKIAIAAVNVFAKKGYSNATMKDIMDEVQISRGGLYAHFENIDTVFLAALKYDDFLNIESVLSPDHMGIEAGEFRDTIDVNTFSELLIATIDGIMLQQYNQFCSGINLSKRIDLLNTMIERILS